MNESRVKERTTIANVKDQTLYWKQECELLKKHDGTVSSFCKLRGHKYWQFLWWRKKFRKDAIGNRNQLVAIPVLSSSQAPQINSGLQMVRINVGAVSFEITDKTSPEWVALLVDRISFLFGKNGHA